MCFVFEYHDPLVPFFFCINHVRSKQFLLNVKIYTSRHFYSQKAIENVFLSNEQRNIADLFKFKFKSSTL